MRRTHNNRFQVGSGVYTCRCCQHRTRNTGGDGAGVQLCDLCFSLAGEENHLSDSGCLYESRENVKAELAALDKRNGAGTAERVWPTVWEAAHAK